MKKIIFILLCVFSIKFVYANELEYIYLPYYARVKKINGDELVVQIKKVYDKETLEVAFNVDYLNYEITDDFNRYADVNRNNYGMYNNNIKTFNNIVYYGYNVNKNDLNYFLTQVLIWQRVCNYSVYITDEVGNVLDDYKEEYAKIVQEWGRHGLNPSWYIRTFTKEIWDTSTYNYENAIILDNPSMDEFVFQNIDNKLLITANKVGEYKINLSKKYDQINYSYHDGKNIYWQNLGGPIDIEKYINYSVYGTKLNINEVIADERVGDSKPDSKYELYLEDELKLTLDHLNDIYVKSNSKYILKDISDNKSLYKIEDIYFDVLDDEFNLTIEKNVISKNISINILDDYTYNVYLKSNDELYEIINKDSNIITLPYGTYYIVNEENNFYTELEVLDDMDEMLTINNVKKENILNDNNLDVKEEIEKVEIFNKEQNIKDKENIEKVDVTKENDIKKEDNSNDKIVLEDSKLLEDENFNEVENPKTNDNIIVYLMINLCNLILFVYLYCFVKN